AYELVKEYVGSKAKVLNVIDPTVTYLGQHYAEKTIGLIGTKQTVLSNVYKKKIDALDCGINLKSLATPLLAAMIEEGFFNNTISESVISTYLSDPHLDDISALILGCTHYPLIKNQIEEYYGGKVDVLDTSELVAEHVKQFLQQHNLFSDKLQSNHHFYVSDFTQSFEEATRIFFGKEVHLEHYPLWE
ncbi:MAG TPA: aspartate/glutamate racemase family protein, partial [Adhaeribacter sp.]|nr:aspartate/glutamate racemase family protein [Adhaeribacter sp.]